ncbi:triple gene block protein 2 [Euonymus yellow mottle associated virus]|uniref:Triple gene block protein 2 n=1 Tax=Euonymus yellow mottle associated virus TaxID=2586645 RepID=A0A4Y5R5F4_9VIRU|nr:triple gene block protein 2 [Euonymus yellow mottle associated virus]QCY52826.1 triple gene block protein 2 [Euonymus yellow mottle associated virus]
MPLTPPPDHSTSLKHLAIGVAIAITIYTASRSNLPHVGDNIHSLPHGGSYRDGTKQILYCSPGSVNSISTLAKLFRSTPFVAFLLAAVLPAIIYVSSSFPGLHRSCNHPSHTHH